MCNFQRLQKSSFAKRIAACLWIQVIGKHVTNTSNDTKLARIYKQHAFLFINFSFFLKIFNFFTRFFWLKIISKRNLKTQTIISGILYGKWFKQSFEYLSLPFYKLLVFFKYLRILFKFLIDFLTKKVPQTHPKIQMINSPIGNPLLNTLCKCFASQHFLPIAPLAPQLKVSQ